MPRAVPLLLPALRPDGPEPLHRQLYHHLRQAILTGGLRAGARLPASRALAATLDVSRNTVIAAFEQLVAEGYIEGRRGSGTVVATLPAPPLGRPREQPAAPRPRNADPAPMLALRPGIPALDAFPHREWGRLLGRRWRRLDPALLGVGEPGGFPPLRRVLAEHLGRSRAVRCEPEQVLIVAGSQQALDLIARVLLRPGDQAMIEDPGYAGMRQTFTAAGAVLAPVPVDDQGFDPILAERLWPKARLAAVTPSHQFPSGATMPLERRLALLDWAERRGGWIIEDDYDSDFRYVGPPLAALQGLGAGDRTLYCGTFSKSMFPALRLGWLVVPAGLLPAFHDALRLAGAAPSTPVQAAMADFMEEGLFAAHLRRMRTLYAERRAALLAAGPQLAGWAEVTAGEAGTHAIAWLAEGFDDSAISQALPAHGLGPIALGRQRLAPGRPGLILGYANMAPAGMQPAMAILGRVLREFGKS